MISEPYATYCKSRSRQRSEPIVCVTPEAQKYHVKDHSGYGFSTIFPNIWLFSMYSWAARVSLSGKSIHHRLQPSAEDVASTLRAIPHGAHVGTQQRQLPREQKPQINRDVRVR